MEGNVIHFEQLTGLYPTAILCVGTGFVREEWKSLCFRSQKSLVQSAIQNSRQIAELLVPESVGRILQASGRLELLRQEMKNPLVRDAIPTLIQRQFRPRFIDGVDRALQHGRMLFVHESESEVFLERLEERLGKDLKREEFFLFNRYWSKLLEARDLWDEARLFEVASERLESGMLPAALQGKTIVKLEHFDDLPRERWFWSQLEKSLEIKRVSTEALLALHLPAEAVPQTLQTHRNHSIEDAAQRLLDELESAKDLDAHAVVIPDDPGVRRTLKRVLESRGLALQDARDPTRVVQSESVKYALLELELVAKGFPVGLVLAWFQAAQKVGRVTTEAVQQWRKAIAEKGLTSGLSSFSTIAPELKEVLNELSARYRSRSTLEELLESLSASSAALDLPAWVLQSLNRVFQEWEEGLQQLGLEGQKRPLRYWFEQLRDKLQKIAPVAPSIRRHHGVRLFRLDQPVGQLLFSQNLTVHFFGVGNRFFEPSELGTEWFSVRDQEALAHEFDLPSIETQTQQRLRSFLAWAKRGELLQAWTYDYSESGAEFDGADLDQMLEVQFDGKVQSSVHERGLHPSLRASFQMRLDSPHLQVEASLEDRAWPISFLNAYGNCPYTAYSAHILKLEDERESDYEIQRDTFGTLVHKALELILTQNLSTEDSVDQAWQQVRQKGWIQNPRLKTANRNKLIKVVNQVMESEKVYQSESGAVPRHFEKPMEWKSGGMTFQGRVDRIDEHSDGWVLIDYKTSSAQASGQKMLELGLDFQLPIYALAVQEDLKGPVITAQYLQVSPQKVNRHVGFLFSQWNVSKKADLEKVPRPITHTRGNSQSLFTESPSEVWSQVKLKSDELVQQVARGQFPVAPADASKTCDRCRFQVACGIRRVSA